MYSFLLLLIVILLSMTILTSSFRLSNRLIRSPLRISMMSSSNNEKKFILEYQYVSDILEKRVPYRSEHLALAEGLEKEGKIIAAGPFSPPSGAVFLFNTNDINIINKFVEQDPYVKAKLVTSYQIKEWNVVIGSLHSKL